MLITAEKELEIQQVAKVDVVVERVRKETEVKQAEKKIKQVEGEIKKIAEETKPEQKWIFEYQRFKSLPVYNKFEIILKSIYQHRGEINVTNNNNQIIFQIPQDILAFSHTNDLIDFAIIASTNDAIFNSFDFNSSNSSSKCLSILIPPFLLSKSAG